MLDFRRLLAHYRDTPMATPLIVAPRSGLLTQGTIFSCAIAEGYQGCPIHGVVITARCDIKNEKTPAYNYLPIVALDDWVHRDGRLILGTRVASDTIAKVKSVLIDCGFVTSVLETQSLSSV